MAIITNAELWFCKVDPKRPNNKFNKKNPTWECQIRTTNKETKKVWESMGLGVKAVIPDEGPSYFRVNLRKKSIKEDGEKASPVKVVNGSLEDIDPNTIGNGSIGNVRIFQYEYPKEGGGTGVASVLMGLQVTKHIVYKAKPRDDDFETTDTETIDSTTDDESDDAPTPSFSVTPTV
jgi:hypothetical protein